MLSTTSPRPADDPHDVLVVASDAVRMAPTDDELSRLARSLLQRPADPPARTGPELAAGSTVPPVAVPSVDTTFRPAATDDVPIRGRRRTASGAARAFLAALLLAIGSGAAAMAWQSYGGAAEQMIARWAPQLAQPAPTAVAAIAAKPASQQTGSPAQAAPDAVAPTPSVETAPSPGAETNDIAGMRQEIDQLKASIDELKAGQQQISRDVAKASEARASEVKASDVRASEVKTFEQNVRSKLSAHRGLATARARKPMPPPLPPRQTAAYPALPPQPAAPYVPRQVEPPFAAEPPADPELASVPRPPMPLR